MNSMLPQSAQTILEVGCGNGYLSLELARDGHDVTGIDLSVDIIEVAERSQAAHPAPPGFGCLCYLCTDVNTYQAADSSFDAVIFNRALHHMHDLYQTMATVKRLLKPKAGSFARITPMIALIPRRPPGSIRCNACSS